MAIHVPPETVEHEAGLALDLIRRLVSEVGPRRPCSEPEAKAAQTVVAWLAERGVDARIEPFRSYSSFAHPYGVMFGASLVGALLQRRGRRSGDALGLASLTALVLEGDLRKTPVSDLLARITSGNVVATIPPREEELRRVCLCGHVDTSRSGLMFDPRITPYLRELLLIPMASAAITGLRPLVRRLPRTRRLNGLAIAGLAFALAMLAERELRGEDVPGANDNASGCGVAAQLAIECVGQPLRHTRLDLLLTGCEEVGTRGAQAYVRSDPERARKTTFINFDSVGGDAPVRYILREGMPFGRPASTRLIDIVHRISARRPDLGLRPAANTGALTTDATVALAHGCDALTFIARERTIPNYHWPTDTYENISPRTVARTLEAGRLLLRELDQDG
jgi:hypothetical protein